MNVKQWALFLVAFLSFDYGTSNFVGNYKGAHPMYGAVGSGYYGWNAGCSCNDDLTSELDYALKSSASIFKNKFPKMPDQGYEGVVLEGGQVRGLHNWQRDGPYRCGVFEKTVRIIFKIKITNISIPYNCRRETGLIGRLVGSIGNLLDKILGGLSNFLLHIKLPEVYLTCVLEQIFNDGKGFQVKGLYMDKIDDIEFTQKRCSDHKEALKPYFKPACDLGFRYLVRNNFESTCRKYFTRVIVKKDQFQSKRDECEDCQDDKDDDEYED